MALIPFDFDYVTRRPEGELGRSVESIWYARGTVPYARERIAPTGSTVAVFVLGEAILQTPDNGAGETLRAERGFIIGPHDRPVVNEPTGETYAIGVVGTPVGCEAVFGVPPSRLRGAVFDLEAVWPAAQRLRERLLELPSAEAQLDLLEGVLRETCGVVSGVARCASAVAMLEAEPTRSIGSIAEALGISHGHLDREFTRIVGLTPRVLARLLRMRRLLEGMDVSGEVQWAELAAELGWFDQAHLIRDFKRHTGVTPSRYLAAQRATYDPEQPGDAAGFVPEG